MTRWSIVFLACVALTPRASFADGARPLSLADAQREARDHAPENAELSARLRGAELSASAAGRIVRTNPILSGTYAPLGYGVGIAQTFDVSGSWGPRHGSALADRDRAFYEREDGLRALDEAVAIAVADMALAQRRLERSTRIVRLQTIATNAARELLAVGQGNLLDLDAAELDLAGVASDAALARAALGVARAHLARLLGRSLDAAALVEDPPESDGRDAAVGSLPLERTPRVQAAHAEQRAAQLELDTQKRMIVPEVTLRVSYDVSRYSAPAGSFLGPASPGLSAAWGERDFSVGLEIPVPLFDLRQPERAHATARIMAADAQVRTVAADVRRDLDVAEVKLVGAADAFHELQATPQILEREFGLIDKALRAGALDAVARAIAIRRLQEAGARYDDSVRELRVARAQWRRLAFVTGGNPP